MKPPPIPQVAGNTPWERLDNAFRTVLKVPREVVLRDEAKLKKRRAKKRAKSA